MGAVRAVWKDPGGSHPDQTAYNHAAALHAAGLAGASESETLPVFVHSCHPLRAWEATVHTGTIGGEAFTARKKAAHWAVHLHERQECVQGIAFRDAVSAAELSLRISREIDACGADE